MHTNIIPVSQQDHLSFGCLTWKQSSQRPTEMNLKCQFLENCEDHRLKALGYPTSKRCDKWNAFSWQLKLDIQVHWTTLRDGPWPYLEIKSKDESCLWSTKTQATAPFLEVATSVAGAHILEGHRWAFGSSPFPIRLYDYTGCVRNQISPSIFTYNSQRPACDWNR